jgi:uncharacterized protein (TIGR02145 family)
MKINNRTHRTLLLASALLLAVAWLCLSGCSKKPERETVPVTTDTLSETINTLSETHDTLSATTDTLHVTFDTLIDTRDGKTYRTVKIGNQVWMAENLNYKPKTGKSWCYNDSDSYCEKYGRLYNWETAKKVCPAGWHLPSRSDWQELVRAVDSNAHLTEDGWDCYNYAGEKLKSQSGWFVNKNNIFYDRSDEFGFNGSDEFGFSALPGGDRHTGGKFYDAGYYGNWWTATESGSGVAYARNMGYYYEYVYENDDNKSHGLSVRCLGN